MSQINICENDRAKRLQIFKHSVAHVFQRDVCRACTNCQFDRLCKLIDEFRTDVNTPLDGDGWTVLHYAAIRNKPQLVRILIDKGADINVQSKYKRTALHYAAMFEHSDIVRILVEAGADSTVVDERGCFALTK